MKNVLVPIGLLALLVSSTAPVPPPAATINWMSWEEAIEATEKEPKKLFIDVYTDWCGWCKRMDATTFADPAVVEYMNSNFYAVKLDAEQKEDIVYKGHTFKYVPSGRRGYHQLAADILRGKMSYPSYVFFNEKQELLTTVPGYQKTESMLKILQYFGTDTYKDTSFQDYQP